MTKLQVHLGQITSKKFPDLNTNIVRERALGLCFLKAHIVDTIVLRFLFYILTEDFSCHIV